MHPSPSFYVVLPVQDKSPLYLCRRRSGDYGYYWDSNCTCRVSFSNTRKTPEVPIDISDARWCTSEGTVLDYVF